MMRRAPFPAELRSRVAPLPIADVDTDQIVPARFLKATDKAGFGARLFYDWRFDAEGRPRPGFVLDDPAFRGAEVLLAGPNFGCGSSREHAAWAIADFGLRAIVSTSFADIFRKNALENSVLPIVVPAEAHAELLAIVTRDPAASVTISLPTESIVLPDGRTLRFPIDAFAKRCLLEGVDTLEWILRQQEAIAAFEAKSAPLFDTRAAR